MANPRQRRKARSGAHKVRLSKHANSRLKKVTPQNFPAGLEVVYNVKQTPTQNYRRLGLLSGKLDPRLAGGIEKNLKPTDHWLSKVKKPDEWDLIDEENEDEVEGDLEEESGEDMEDDTEDRTVEVSAAPSKKLAKGEGRIVRDADGKILKVILGDETDIEIENCGEDPTSIVIVRPPQEPKTQTPWGNPLQAAPYENPPTSVHKRATDSAPVPQGITYQGPRLGKVEPKTTFVARKFTILIPDLARLIAESSLHS